MGLFAESGPGSNGGTLGVASFSDGVMELRRALFAVLI
jgi:hypothetical protein